MIRLVDWRGHPATGASYIEARHWSDIAEPLRTLYPIGDAAPECGQSDLYHWEGDEEPLVPEKPKIVCLCGSTRFMEAFHEANRRESLAGKIVLTVEIVRSEDDAEHNNTDPARKRFLDELHLRKIDLADEVLVLNVGGYVGESTRREIEYARSKGKRVLWWEPDNVPEELAA